MRKGFTILAGIVLLCSCEKIDSHYTYEEVVPVLQSRRVSWEKR